MKTDETLSQNKGKIFGIAAVFRIRIADLNPAWNPVADSDPGSTGKCRYTALSELKNFPKRAILDSLVGFVRLIADSDPDPRGNNADPAPENC